jgi:hypothetical protein
MFVLFKHANTPDHRILLNQICEAVELFEQCQPVDHWRGGSVGSSRPEDATLVHRLEPQPLKTRPRYGRKCS